VNRTRVTWWGHSTTWLEESGVTLLTDPLLSNRLIHLKRMAGGTPALPGPPDAVLLSHLHATTSTCRRCGPCPASRG
jgi:L-ascorbate metabolism protein UlaG (beta-lactamase superfamily)